MARKSTPPGVLWIVEERRKGEPWLPAVGVSPMTTRASARYARHRLGLLCGLMEFRVTRWRREGR